MGTTLDMRTLISNSDILARLRMVAAEIRNDPLYPNLQPVVLAEGARPMARDLLPLLPDLPPVLTIRVSSYGDSRTPITAPRLLDPWPRIDTGLNVLIIDDVLDTGQTLAFFRQRFVDDGICAIRICVLLDKQLAGRVPVYADYVGFTVGSRFVVGYGMDLAGRYRDLPDIAVLD